MDKPTISIIVAMGAKNRVIGKNNELPWHIPEDMKRFKVVTTGHPVIMGRKTWESIPEKFRPLSDRTNIIITRNSNYVAKEANIATSITDALGKAFSIDKKEVFVIGGASIYEQALPLADKLYVTLVEGDFDGDTFFPDYSDFKKVLFKKPSKYKHLTYTFLELKR